MNKVSTGGYNATCGSTSVAHENQGNSSGDASEAATEPRKKLVLVCRGSVRAWNCVRLRDCRQPIHCEPTRLRHAREALRYCSRNTRREPRVTLRALVRRLRHQAKASVRQSVRLHGGPWGGRFVLLHDASGTLPLCVRVGGKLYRGRYVRHATRGGCLQWQPAAE